MDPDFDAKRALQDFSLLHQCLTSELWQTLWNSQHHQKEEGLLNYAFDLGLGCPSGSTIQCMTALIHLVDMQSLSAGELYIRQRKVSNAFRALRIGLEKQMGMTKDVIRTLNPSDIAVGMNSLSSTKSWMGSLYWENSFEADSSQSPSTKCSLPKGWNQFLWISCAYECCIQWYDDAWAWEKECTTNSSDSEASIFMWSCFWKRFKCWPSCHSWPRPEDFWSSLIWIFFVFLFKSGRILILWFAYNVHFLFRWKHWKKSLCSLRMSRICLHRLLVCLHCLTWPTTWRTKWRLDLLPKKTRWKKRRFQKRKWQRQSLSQNLCLQKNPVYRSLSNKRRMQLTNPNQNRRVQRNMNPGLEFLQVFCTNIVLDALSVDIANFALARVGTAEVLRCNLIAMFLNYYN